MQHIVDSELTPASWQLSVNLGAIAVVVALIAGLAVVGALQVAAYPAAALAGVAGIAALAVIGRTYARINGEN